MPGAETSSTRVRVATSAEDLAHVGALWREYWDTLGLGDAFQSFAAELADLPGRYDPILLAIVHGSPAGAIAVRPCAGQGCSGHGEVKRLYVRPAFRGCGIARTLLEAAVDAARARGYRMLFADTLPSMTAALTLYRARGFVATGPYADNPTPGAIYLKLEL